MSDTLAALKGVLAKATPEQKAEIIAALPKDAWVPNPGPQTAAMNSKADLLLYGGAAGGGKTDLLVGLALTRHERSVIYRLTFQDLRGVEDRLIAVAGRDGYNATDMRMKRDGRVIEFGALEKPGAEFGWQGRAHDFYGFDEGAQLSQAKVRFVIGWLRTTTPGQRCRIVIASNPPIGSEGDWLIEWFAPWLDPMFPEPAKDGELRWAIVADRTIWVDGPGWWVPTSATEARPATPEEIADALNERGEAKGALSRTFIPARLSDNPHLRGTGYRAQIQAMPEPIRTKLLEGDFLSGREDHERQVIPSAWIEAAQERWKRGKPQGARMLALGVDVAQGGKDETALAPLFGTWFGELIVRPGVTTPDGKSVAALVVATIQHGAQVTIDLTAAWGSSARDHLLQHGFEALGVVFSAGSTERTKDERLGFLNMRSQLWWRLREALDPDSADPVALPPDRKLAAELAAPLWSLRGDRVQIESKDELRKRLGSSTDRADAVMLAWHDRARAVFKQQQRIDPAPMYVPDYDPFGPYDQTSGSGQYVTQNFDVFGHW